ncbi:MAG: I78 family peptidase inhibitor [Pseudomonadota bacterium]
MKRLATPFLAISLLGLAACSGSADDASTTNEADDFAARINGGATTTQTQGNTDPAAGGAQSGGAAPASYVPGTVDDPNATNCNAASMAPFIGQTADNAVRSEIVATVSSTNEVRFIMPGATFINPDPSSSRLNIMIDNLGVIRDARCG